MALQDLWPLQHISRYPGFIAHDVIDTLQGYMGSGFSQMPSQGGFYSQGELKTHIGSDVVSMWAGVANSAGNVPLSLDSERKAQDPFLGQPCKCDVEKLRLTTYARALLHHQNMEFDRGTAYNNKI